jgi:uncharacterized protein (DUF1697 family)
MPVYISMLRGVNVGGHNRMKMDQLRNLFAPLGCEQAQTYIQSGNVVFRAARQSSLALSQKIEKSIQAEFGFSVTVVTKTSAEMGATIQNNPFLKKRGVDVSNLHVTFLSQAPDATALKKLAAVDGGPDEFAHSGEVIYLYCQNRYSETKLSNSFLEKALAIHATTRNWTTVNKLYEMAVECA